MMDYNVFSNMSQQSMNMYQPLMKFNQVLLTCCEKVARAQTDAIRCYAEMSLDRLHDVATTDEVTNMSEFMAKQTQFMDGLSKKMTEDLNNLMHIGNELNDALFKFTEENSAPVQAVKPLKKTASTSKTPTPA